MMANMRLLIPGLMHGEEAQSCHDSTLAASASNSHVAGSFVALLMSPSWKSLQEGATSSTYGHWCTSCKIGLCIVRTRLGGSRSWRLMRMNSSSLQELVDVVARGLHSEVLSTQSWLRTTDFNLLSSLGGLAASNRMVRSAHSDILRGTALEPRTC